jgi:hypothetical protein
MLKPEYHKKLNCSVAGREPLLRNDREMGGYTKAVSR